MRLLTDAETARLRRRAADPAWEPAWAKLREAVAYAERHELAPADEGAGWWHDYTCPAHGVTLDWDPAARTAHRCPVDGEVLTGAKLDAAWRWKLNASLAAAAHAGAVLWVGTGDAAGLATAGGILTAYARKYAAYPPHGRNAGKGRATGQSLDEAVWVIPLARAYDAARAALPPADRELIERDLLRPAGEHLLTQRLRGVHNIACWILAGLATLGAVLDEDQFLAPVSDAEHGLAGQLAGGVADDGWWWEGSPTYHFYTLEAVTNLCVPLRAARPAALGDPKLRLMFAAPPQLARADGSLPATNDGWVRVSTADALRSMAPAAEVAAALWPGEETRGVLRKVYPPGAARASDQALVFGPDLDAAAAATAPAATAATAAPAPRPAVVPPLVHRASGYGVVRAGATAADQRWAMLKFGPHGGGHGHPDKLAVDVWALGRPLCADLGTPGYGIPLNAAWYRQTLSHATFTVARRSQPPHAGRLLNVREGGAFSAVEAGAAWAAGDETLGPYAGVDARRALLLRHAGDTVYAVDVLTIRCPDERPLELAWHHAGAVALGGLADAALPEATDPYARLTDVRRTDAATWAATFRAGVGRGAGGAGEVGTAYFAHNPPGTATYAARSPGNPASDVRATVLRRVDAVAARFVAVFEPFRGEPGVRRVTWPPAAAHGAPLRFTVDGDGWIDDWSLAAADAGHAGVADCVLCYTMSQG